MGYSTSIVHESGQTPWSVFVKVRLTRAEGNDLFLSGDSLVSWPAEGLGSAIQNDNRPERSGMFVSEMAAQPQGLVVRYREQSQAERAAALLRMQFARIGIKEEI